MTPKRAMDAARAVIDGLTTADQGEGVYYAFAEALEAYAAEEREACVKLIEYRRHLNATGYFSHGDVCEFEDAIRARGQGTGEV